MRRCELSSADGGFPLSNLYSTVGTLYVRVIDIQRRRVHTPKGLFVDTHA